MKNLNDINEKLEKSGYRLELVDYGARLRGLRILYREGLLVNLVFSDAGEATIDKIISNIDDLLVFKNIDK